MLIMITPRATGDAVVKEERRKGGREIGRGRRGGRAGCSFPIATYDLWTLFWFAAVTPTIAYGGRIGAAQARGFLSSAGNGDHALLARIPTPAGPVDAFTFPSIFPRYNGRM